MNLILIYPKISFRIFWRFNYWYVKHYTYSNENIYVSSSIYFDWKSSISFTAIGIIIVILRFRFRASTCCIFFILLISPFLVRLYVEIIFAFKVTFVNSHVISIIGVKITVIAVTSICFSLLVIIVVVITIVFVWVLLFCLWFKIFFISCCFRINLVWFLCRSSINYFTFTIFV